MWVKLGDIDLNAGARPLEMEDEDEIMDKKTLGNLPMRIVRALF